MLSSSGLNSVINCAQVMSIDEFSKQTGFGIRDSGTS